MENVELIELFVDDLGFVAFVFLVVFLEVELELRVFYAASQIGFGIPAR